MQIMFLKYNRPYDTRISLIANSTCAVYLLLVALCYPIKTINLYILSLLDVADWWLKLLIQI